MAIKFGTRGSDVLAGTPSGDLIVGRGGDDVINAGNGDDFIISGTGDDTISGGEGNDILLAGKGNDVVSGGAGSDFIDAGAGNDILEYVAADRVDGDVDVYSGGRGDDTLKIYLTQAEFSALQNELDAYLAFLDEGRTNRAFTFDSIGLTVSSIEHLDIVVSGEPPQAMVNVPDPGLSTFPSQINEDSQAVISGVTVDIPGQQNGTVEVTISTSSGQLAFTDETDTSSLTFVDGDGSDGALTFIGSETAVNAALAHSLLFSTSENLSGTAQIDFVVSDPSNVSAPGESSLSINVVGIADAPIISATVPPGEIVQSQPFALPISVSLADTDGSEVISSVGISGLEAGFTISDGVNTSVSDGGSTLDLAGWDLANLEVTPDAGFSGDLSLTLFATSTEIVGGSAATSTTSLDFSVAPAPLTAVEDHLTIPEGDILFFDPRANDFGGTGPIEVVGPQLLIIGSGDAIVQAMDAETIRINVSHFDALNVGDTEEFIFDYTVRDANGATSTAPVTVLVEGTNDAPIALPGGIGGTEGYGYTFDFAKNFTIDYDDDTETGAFFVNIVNVSDSLGGISGGIISSSGRDVQLNAFDLGLPADVRIFGSFDYTITDPHGAVSNIATISVSIVGTEII